MEKATLQVPADFSYVRGSSAPSSIASDEAGQAEKVYHAASNRPPESLATYSRRATLGHHQPPLTETEIWFLGARYLKLTIGTTLGALALFLSSNDGLNATLYGANWERAWIWWTLTVPFYLFCTIYFTRFVGSYLMRIWMWEIVNSPWVHQAVITLLAGILSEDSADVLLMAALTKPAVVEGISMLTAALINSDPVQGASVHTVIGVLVSPKVQDAAATATERLLADPGLVHALGDLLGNEAFAKPVAQQLARIMQHEELSSAMIGFAQQILEHREVRDLIKRRAKSVAGDAELFTAGRKGLWESMAGSASADGPTHAVFEIPYSIEE